MSDKNSREILKNTRRLVIKIGSSLLADLKSGINLERIAHLAEQVATLHKRGIRTVIVSSGAVAAGSARLGFEKRPDTIPHMQAAAAVGQGKLMRYYAEAFSKYDISVGQMLLTRDGIDDRPRYLNARNTLSALLELGAVPIVNENDTIVDTVMDEIQFGDNDQLSSLVASMAEADLLVILSDVDGLHECAPAEGESPLITFVPEITPEVEAKAGISTSGVSRGGMASKLSAAQHANANGVSMVIASGKEPNIIVRLFDGEELGTLFPACESARRARKQWLAGRSTMGRIFVDAGAQKAIIESGKSLLPIGIISVEGEIKAEDNVSIVDADGREFARGICNFSSEQLRRIARKQTTELAGILGENCATTVVHRDHLVVLNVQG